MNTDYVILMRTKSGRAWSYRKEKNGWSQTASTGIVRPCSGDQLLSHLLPPLAGDQPGLSVTVERRRRRLKKTPSRTGIKRPTPNWDDSTARQSLALPEEKGCVAK
jgi:hypothetical protein